MGDGEERGVFGVTEGVQRVKKLDETVGGKWRVVMIQGREDDQGGREWGPQGLGRMNPDWMLFSLSLSGGVPVCVIVRVREMRIEREVEQRQR